MSRLTINKEVSEMNMIELAHNSCYVKDGNARYRDYYTDMDAREMTRNLLENLADDAFKDNSDKTFDEVIADYLQYGTSDLVGLIAVFYRNLWAMADLRERLKEYEDLEEQGKLFKVPFEVGDMIYQIMVKGFYEVPVYEVFKAKVLSIDLNTLCFWTETEDDKKYQNKMILSEFGKTVFLTKEEAEAALEKGRLF